MLMYFFKFTEYKLFQLLKFSTGKLQNNTLDTVKRNREHIFESGQMK